MRKKVGLIILDGVGIGNNTKGNAFKQASHPTLDKLLKYCPHCILQASGTAVGLPKGQPGNSEIGHLNIGSGRTFYSELLRINKDVEENKFTANPNLKMVIKLAKQKKVKIHIVGLASYGGVHSNLTHMLSVLNECGRNRVKTVAHIISDGRDVNPGSILKNLKQIKYTISKYSNNIKIGTISGRYYAMDRDQNWNRSLKTINTMMHKGPFYKDLDNYIKKQFKNKKTDEFIIPAFNSGAADTKLEKNDIVFFINFRQDRARQLSHLFKKTKLYKQASPAWPLNLTLVTMVKYDGVDSDVVIYPPQKITMPLGEIISKAGLKQLRIAETEKYAHVTYFLDGGTEQIFSKEKKVVIPSPKVSTYDLKPEMSANKITSQLLKHMDKFDFIVCNYANCDMVGHTGKMKPTIHAIETVDTCLEKVLKKARQIGMSLFITSDHGNCDKIIDANNKLFTSHTTSPVFFICTDTKIKLKNGSLSNIAPTILKYLQIKIPKQMDKKPLF